MRNRILHELSRLAMPLTLAGMSGVLGAWLCFAFHEADLSPAATVALASLGVFVGTLALMGIACLLRRTLRWD